MEKIKEIPEKEIQNEELVYLNSIIDSIEQQLAKYRNVIKDLMRQKKLIFAIRKKIKGKYNGGKQSK